MHTFRIEDFDLDHTLRCGQVFRWEQHNGWWVGIVEGHIIKARQEDTTLIVDTGLDRDRIFSYFRLGDNMRDIYARINRDPVMDELIQRFRGLRLIKQEPWECLISYMASSCKSIPNIRDSLYNLCRSYGEDLGGYYSFPSAVSLASTTETHLRRTKLGFRSSNILDAAKKVAEGQLDLQQLVTLDYITARRKLMELRGIGPKIADCVLLFAFDKMDAFPVDTHILSVMDEHYGDFLNGPKSRLCETICDFAGRYFGEFAGYAQQYLYYSRVSEGVFKNCGKI